VYAPPGGGLAHHISGRPGAASGGLPRSPGGRPVAPPGPP
jgi:hypothetical protein